MFFSSGTESLFSYLFVYICIVVGDPMIKEGVWYSINGLNQPHVSVRPKPGAGFQMQHCSIFFLGLLIFLELLTTNI